MKVPVPCGYWIDPGDLLLGAAKPDYGTDRHTDHRIAKERSGMVKRGFCRAAPGCGIRSRP